MLNKQRVIGCLTLVCFFLNAINQPVVLTSSIHQRLVLKQLVIGGLIKINQPIVLTKQSWR